MSTSFPSFFAGPCMPTHSHGTAGRSTMPEARSYSSMCFQTAKAQEEWLESFSGDKPSLKRGMTRGRKGGREGGRERGRKEGRKEGREKRKEGREGGT
uniref:Uncharacterized protein n=1 Tax=Castor canadensis TaxID=51338 RepID=A0A8C0WK05_CASCN